MKTYIKRIVLIMFFCFCSQSAYAATSEEIVDGFSEFLIDRANANMLAVFERRLKNDDNFKCYFPNTYKKIENIKLKNLFGSKSYWEESLRKDLEVLINRSLLAGIQQCSKLIDRNKLIKSMTYFEYEYKGKRYPIDRIGLAWPRPLRYQVNGFSYGIFKPLNVLSKLNQDYKDIFDDNECQALITDVSALKIELRQFLSEFGEVGQELIEWSKHVARYGKNLRLSDYGKKVLYCSINNITDADCPDAEFNEFAFVSKLLKSSELKKIDKLSLIDGKKEIVEILVIIMPHISPYDPMDARLISYLNMLLEDEQSYSERALIGLEMLQITGSLNSASYKRISKSVLLFANLADAKDKEAVKDILEAYTLPAVSFEEKRKIGVGVFVSSYFGAAYADPNIHNSDEDPLYSGLFVPVGLDLNYAFVQTLLIRLCDALSWNRC